jgi:hypothetical protein
MPGSTGGSHHTDQVVITQDRGRLDMGKPIEQGGQSRPYFPGSSHITITNHVIGVDAMVLRSESGDE